MEYREALSFDDVLLVPRYSDLKSRKEANIATFGFSNPVGMTPMDTVTSPAMIKLFVEKGMLASVHRYFKTPSEQHDFACQAFNFNDMPLFMDNVYFAVGSVHKYKDWIDWLFNNGIRKFIVDMAHGESTLCTETVQYIRAFDVDDKSEGSEKLMIIAGNVVTKSGFNRLQEAGANGIRVGIGSGCFVPDMLVNTNCGLKRIEDVKIGDVVYTHTGELKPVVGKLSYETNEELIEINGDIKCTKNHEFYVINKKFEHIVNEHNIHQYAEWIRADELTDEYMMLELEV